MKVRHFSFHNQVKGNSSNPVKSFIFKIDHNECLNFLKRKRLHLEIDEMEFEEWENVLFHTDYKGIPLSPDVVIEYQDQFDILEQCMETLSNSQVAAIYYWLQGYSYKEISQLTGKTESKIRGYIWHGLKKLRNYLDD